MGIETAIIIHMDEAVTLAKVLWDYHYIHKPIHKSDVIIALGNSDIRTAERAAELMNQGVGRLLVVTGGFGRLTINTFKKPESHLFAERAAELGVSPDSILIEDQSTNTFDNIRFTKKLLNARGITPTSVIVVTKPYMERRAIETFCSVWPDVSVSVTSPDLDFDTYPNNAIPIDLLINMVVGDLQRLMIFSESGHVAQQQFPTKVFDAYHGLIRLGYDKQVIPDANIPDLLRAVAAGGIA
jgi:uncharacterized SAM-binding protein YcdF (DUF218 family)